MKNLKYLFIVLIVFVACENASEKSIETNLTNTELLAKATEIHKRVLTLDTHNDINIKNFTDSINYTQELDNQVNLHKKLIKYHLFIIKKVMMNSLSY